MKPRNLGWALIVLAVVILSTYAVFNESAGPNIITYVLIGVLVFFVIFFVATFGPIAQKHEQKKEELFTNLQLSLGGNLTKNNPGLFNSGKILLALSGTRAKFQYSIELIYTGRKGQPEKLEVSVRVAYPFSVVFQYCGNLDPVTEKLFWAMNAGGERYKNFWFKSDNPALAKNFIDKNETELQRLFDKAKPIEWIRMKDGKFTVATSALRESGAVIEQLDMMIGISKRG